MAALSALLCSLSASAQSVKSFNQSVLARNLLDRHLTDSAAKTVDLGLAADSLSAPLWNVRARILRERGDRRGQEAALRRVLAISPDFTEAHQSMAEIFCDSGLTDSARKYLALPLRIDSTNPRAIYYNGLIHEQTGGGDTATVLYSQAYEKLSANDLMRIPVCPGYRIQHTRLRTTGSGAAKIPNGKSTLILFWATWSPQSLKAFKAIMEKLPQSGISWNLLPVNVDRREWTQSIRARADAKARELGYKDTVAIDSGLVLFDRLGLVTVPTLVVANISGDVDELIAGWSKKASNHVLNGVLAKTDTTKKVVRNPVDTCEAALRRLGTAWLHWEQSDQAAAMVQISRATKMCSTIAYPHALSAVFRCWNGDTARAGRDAVRACTANPNDPWAWLARAEVERRRVHPDSSRAALKRAMVLDSTLSTGWVINGRLAADARDTIELKRSISVLDRLDRIDPGLPVLRALMHQVSGRWAEAAKAWRDIIRPRLRT